RRLYSQKSNVSFSKSRSFKALKKELLSIEKLSRDRKIFELKYTKFQIDENLNDYFDKISRLIEEIYGPNQNQLIRDNILAGLDYKIVSRLMINQKLPDDITEIKNLVENIILSLSIETKMNIRQVQKSPHKIKKSYCKICKNNSHNNNKCRSRN
ncbi:hypothetical protein SSS_09707, partial [Sarcoptes scabiei]